MKKLKILLVVLLLCSVLPTHTLADSSIYLSEEEGVEMDWTFTETPPKRPQPKLLNPTKYECKWKIDNRLLISLVQDQQGVMYTSDFDDIVHAIYPNGKEKWNLKLELGYKSVVYLAMGEDGTLYAYGSDHLSEKELTTIFAISPEGKIKWKQQSNDIYSKFSSQFAGDAQGNLLYFTNEGLVSCNANGEINWVNKDIKSREPMDFQTNDKLINIYLDAQGNSYLDCSYSEIVSISPSGEERWRSKPLDFINMKTWWFLPYISSKGFMYILNEYGLNAINTNDGSIVDVSVHTDMEDIKSSGIPTDGMGGYYISNRGKVQKINRDGEMIWEYKPRDTEEIGLASISFTDKDGIVYFTTNSGNIIGLNSEGKEQFVFLRNAFWTKMVGLAIGRNGNIYSTNWDIGLAAFGKKEIQVYVDNLSLPLSIPPINKEGTVLVPFRAFFEGLGLKINWDPATKTITGSKIGLEIKLVIGEQTAYVNGKAQELAEPPIMEGDTSFVPLRFVGEAIGKKVSWDGDSSSINLDS